MIYEMRYWVKTLFGNHKSRGFQLARTHMTDPEHIDRLVLVLAIATCIALGLGTYLILIEETHQVNCADRREWILCLSLVSSLKMSKPVSTHLSTL